MWLSTAWDTKPQGNLKPPGEFGQSFSDNTKIEKKQYLAFNIAPFMLFNAIMIMNML